MKKILIGLGVVFLIVMVIGGIGANTPEGKEKSEQRDKIARCWELQGKKSLEQSTARFAASLCEKMESEFLQRWNVKP
jgi:hypothetical protein